MTNNTTMVTDMTAKNIEKSIIIEHAKITEKIIEIVLNEVDDVLAILYIGSWSNIEMSYTLSENGVDFLNDIDVLVITKEKIDNIKYIRDLASKAINKDYFSYEDYVTTTGAHNFYVDIRNYVVDDLKNIIHRIKYYDIFTDAKPIYVENDDVVKLFPTIELKKIPYQDSLIHLFNRMALLVEWNPIIVNEDRKLLIFVLKAYSAILDSLLLKNGKYVTSLKQKAHIFNDCYKTDFYELWKILPNLHDRVGIMVDMKINYYKYHENIDDKKILDIWINSKRDIMIVTIYMINYIYKTNFELALDTKNICDIVDFLKSKNGFAVEQFIKEYSKKRFGLYSPLLANLAYMLIRYRYFSKFDTIDKPKKREIITKTFSDIKEPTSELYLATFSLLGGIDYLQDKVIYNKDLIYMANSHLDNISLQKYNKINVIIDDIVINRFKEIFRIWELFTFG